MKNYRRKSNVKEREEKKIEVRHRIRTKGRKKEIQSHSEN